LTFDLSVDTKEQDDFFFFPFVLRPLMQDVDWTRVVCSITGARERTNAPPPFFFFFPLQMWINVIGLAQLFCGGKTVSDSFLSLFLFIPENKEVRAACGCIGVG